MVKRIVFTDNCMGCGQCLEVCRYEALSVHGYTVKHNSDRCVSCGDCLKIDCSGECFSLATIDTVSELKPCIELPIQSGGI